MRTEYGQIYGEAREWRERVDYRFGVVFNEETARQIVDRAERIVARLEQFLHEHGLLTEKGKEQ